MRNFSRKYRAENPPFCIDLDFQHPIEIPLLANIQFFLTHEFQIFFRENEILECFFEIDRILATFGEKEILVRILCKKCSDIFTGNTRIESEESSFFPLAIYHRFDDFHAHCTDEDIVIDIFCAKLVPEFFMSFTF